MKIKGFTVLCINICFHILQQTVTWICCTCHILSNNAWYAETSLKLHWARSRLRSTFGDRRKRGPDASECRARNGEGVHTVHLAYFTRSARGTGQGGVQWAPRDISSSAAGAWTSSHSLGQLTYTWGANKNKSYFLKDGKVACRAGSKKKLWTARSMQLKGCRCTGSAFYSHWSYTMTAYQTEVLTKG